MALAAGVVLVSHPTTAVVFLTGLAAGFVARVRDRIPFHGVQLAAIVGLAVACAAAWPYFPFFDLFGTQAAEFNASSRILYRDVWGRLWPSLLVAPAVLWRLCSDRRDVLAIWLGLLALVYAFGFLSGSYGLGRCIAYVALVLQLAAAGLLGRAEIVLAPRWRRLVVSAAAAVIFTLASRNPEAFAACWPPAAPRTFPLAFLREFVGPHDVVLSDIQTGFRVPAFAGQGPFPLRPPAGLPLPHLRRVVLKIGLSARRPIAF